MSSPSPPGGDPSGAALQAELAAVHAELAATRSELADTRRRLDLAVQDLRAFAFSASHDLQAPLRSVQIYAELLGRRVGPELDADARASLQHVQVSCRRAQNMLRGLLTLSRVETEGKDFEPVPLDEAVEQVLRALQPRLEAARAQVDVGPLPVVRADPAQVLRLWTELLDNALRYRGEAPPRIQIRAEPAEAGFAAVTVADRGVGLDPASTERVFHVFRRLHEPDDEERLGVGLALCRRIVLRHGGTIQATPRDGGGAVLRFTLPAA